MLFIPTSGNGFFVYYSFYFCSFVLVETIIQIKVKPLQSNLSPTIKNHFLGVLYIYIFPPLKIVFPRSEMYCFNKSLIPAGEIKVLVQWKQYSFIYSFSFFLRKPLLAPKFVSLAGMKNFLEIQFPLNGKKIYQWQQSLKKREKESFPIARKSVVHEQE